MQKTTGGSALVCMKMSQKKLIIKALRGPLSRAVNRKMVIIVGKYYKLILKKKQRDQNSSKKASNCTSKLFQTRRLQTLQNLLPVMKQR